MLEALKVGDMVRTAGGIIGRIVKISDKGEIKTVVLETGTKTEKSYMEFDLSMIYCVLKSSKVETEESEGKAETKTESNAEVPANELVEPKAEEPQKQEKAAETPAKKRTKTTTSQAKKKTK